MIHTVTLEGRGYIVESETSVGDIEHQLPLTSIDLKQRGIGAILRVAPIKGRGKRVLYRLASGVLVDALKWEGAK